MSRIPRRSLAPSSLAVAVAVALAAPVANAQTLASANGTVATEFEKLHFRSIGPATMSGRIADIAVYENNSAIWYVGSAHGGLWKTTSNGATFTPLFQDAGLISVGDVAVSQSNADLVWLGAGESNNRQSTSWGGGVYKSTDGGKTFALMGLANSKHINRIIIDPRNNDVVLVAATGPLFGSGGERGVYKTTDGGKSWKLVLKGDDDTGANDLAQAATDPNTLFATMYQRRRTACCMNGGGTGSGLWKSTDAGDTWTRVTGGGFPAGPLGRIAVDVFRQSANILYAEVEGAAAPLGGRGGAPADESAPAAAAPAAGGRGVIQQAGTTGVYRSNDGGATWTKTSSVNPRPMYFSQLRIDPNSPDRIYMGGVGMHMSIDGGKNFESDAAMAAHDDVHAIWIDPKNSDHLIIGDDGGVYTSYDMSRTWTFIPNIPVGLFYHVSFDMDYPFNVCGGMQDNYDWCGPSASRMSRGIFNYDWINILGGDGFVAIPDLRDSRIVYTESQDGNMIRRNKVTGESKSIRPTTQNVSNATAGEAYRFHWDTPLMFSPSNPGVLLAAANRVFRSTNRGDTWEAISPDLTKNEKRDDIVTMGLKGSDITISRNDGISQWPTIVALGESPKMPGVYYTGTDDGTVSMTRDGGKTWTNITKNLPGFPAGHAFVSEVVPSRYDAGTVYITVDNHRQNDYDPYVWMSTDFGATFKLMTSGLKGEVIKTLTEDTRNADVLYVGTETGIFLSLDRGASWRRFKANLPTVRVDELTIHPRDNALLIATHGRALWILDHLEPIQEYAAAQKMNAAMFSVGPSLQWKSKDDRNDEFWGHQFFTGENPPTETVMQFHLKGPATKPAIRISDASGSVIRELAIPDAKNVAGIQTVCWDQRVESIPAAGTPVGPAGGRGGAGGPGGAFGANARGPIPGVPEQLPPIGYKAENPCAGAGGPGGGFGGRGGGGGNQGPMVIPGNYTASLVVDGAVVDKKPLTIVMDPQVQLTGAARVAYNNTLMDLHGIQLKGAETAAKLTALYTEMGKVVSKVDSSTAPADVKEKFNAFRKDFDAVRAKFGVGAPQLAAFGPGAGGGGGRGAGPSDGGNVIARAGNVKGAIGGVWETPSAEVMKQVADVKKEVPAAIAEANAILERARGMSAEIGKYGVTLLAPAK